MKKNYSSGNMKLFFLLPIILLHAFSAYGQNSNLTLEKGVAAHKEIDAIYRQFGEAYRTLDSEKVTNLYSENAAYLPPDSEILKGREQIRPTFQSFFDWVKKEGRTMTISFRIVQRKVEKNLGYDVGIYTITQFKDGKNLGSGEGKFIVVAVKEKDGKWRFQVDGYNNLKPENKQEGVESLTLDKEIVNMWCPATFNESGSCPKSKVNLKVDTLSQDAEKNNLKYYYVVSGGKIIGQGANVVWDFSNAAPGKYTITAGVGSDDIFRGNIITKTIELKECSVCDPPCECPTVEISGPKKPIKAGNSFVVRADASDGFQNSIKYHWQVTSGTIVGEKNNSQIVVKTNSKDKNKTITVTVDLSGLCATCPMIEDSETFVIE